MQKKSNNFMTMGIIGGIIVVLFIAIIVLNNMANNDKLADNPYDTDNLNQSTIDLLSDENYQNIILPGDLEDKINTGDTVYAYMFSPECSHCKNFTPKLMPIAEEYDIHIDQLNVLEYKDQWEKYSIEGTPTLIVFKDGQEVNRLYGDHEEATVRAFFDSVE